MAAYADFQIKHDPSTQLCAGWAQGGDSSCQGDSGGPLMIRDARGHVAATIGIVSWADRCGVAGRPTNFAWVGGPSIRPWIASTTAQLSVPDPAPVAAPAPAPGPDRDGDRAQAARRRLARVGRAAARCGSPSTGRLA